MNHADERGFLYAPDSRYILRRSCRSRGTQKISYPLGRGSKLRLQGPLSTPLTPLHPLKTPLRPLRTPLQPLKNKGYHSKPPKTPAYRAPNSETLQHETNPSNLRGSGVGSGVDDPSTILPARVEVSRARLQTLNP